MKEKYYDLSLAIVILTLVFGVEAIFNIASKTFPTYITYLGIICLFGIIFGILFLLYMLFFSR